MSGPRKPLHGDRPELGQLPIEEDVQREIDFHIDMRARELVEQGWDPASARREAERLFGDRAPVSDDCAEITAAQDRATRRAHRMDALRQDLRYAWRTFGRNPAFTAVAVLTLALGLGANAAVFSVVNGVLLRPLPHPDSEAIVWIAEHHDPRGADMWLAWGNFVDWREQSTALSHFAVFGAGPTTVLGGEEPYSSTYAAVTTDFWGVFRPVPVRGRLTTPEEHVEGAEPVVVLREDLWRGRYAERPLEQIRIELQGRPVRVVGVVPADFSYPTGVEIWGVLVDNGTSRTAHNYRGVGRLAPGATAEQAEAELDAIHARVTEGAEASEYLATGARVAELRTEMAGNARRPLMLLMGAAGMVLLIACTNLASTLLARGAGRGREMAVRSALGAGRGRLVRQLLTESLLLSLLGGLGGLMVAAGVLRVLTAFAPVSVPRLDEVAIDPWVLLFTFVASVATAVVFGLLPALTQAREDVAITLRSGGRQNSARSRARAWNLLVGTEVALAFLLLTGSGLLIRSFQAVLDTERGFVTEGVMSASVSLDRARYTDRSAHAAFYDELLPRLAAAPEIDHVGLVTRGPMMFPSNGRLELDGDLSKYATATYVNASGGYFDAIGIELVNGRLFDERDRPDTEHVALVSESFAEEYWPGLDPIGRTLTGGGMDEFWEERRFARVVGVVTDARYHTLERETGPTVYFPYRQRQNRIVFAATLVARSEQAEASALVAPMRRVLREIDSSALPRFASMEERVRDSVAPRTFSVTLLGAFGGLALLLAAVGIYGVVSYNVARRTREMGIRLALGAEPTQVGRLVQGGAMRMIAAGAVVGILGSLALTRLLESMLFGVRPNDVTTLAAATLVLVGTAWITSLVPARRATRVDPLVTMRTE